MVKWILDFQWTHGFSLTTAHIFFMFFFLLVTVFAIHFKREYVYQGAEDEKPWRDLRIWAAVIMAIQVGLYLKF